MAKETKLKRLTIEIDEELRRTFKSRASLVGKSIKQMLLELIIKFLRKEK